MPVTEYSPWMREHTTNHCECLPRVLKTDPNLDFRTCPGFQNYHIQEQQYWANEYHRELAQQTKNLQQKITPQTDPRENDADCIWEKNNKNCNKNGKTANIARKYNITGRQEFSTIQVDIGKKSKETTKSNKQENFPNKKAYDLKYRK